MINIKFAQWKEEKPIQKSVLYRINGNHVIHFAETHNDTERKELIHLNYELSDDQYGIFAYEYRRPDTIKDGNKTADILACVIDEAERSIYTTICDVKSNISAFSDNLLKDQAMLTAIKDVRDFIEQIHAEILHKNTFMLYYIDDGFKEYERIGIITEHFEDEKFLAVALKLEELFYNSNSKVSKLSELKLKKNLAPYIREIEKIRNFSNKMIKIGNRTYKLHVILLEKMDDAIYTASMEIMAENEWS